MERPDVEALRAWKHLPTTQYLFRQVDNGTLEINDQISSLVSRGATRDEIADKAIYLSGLNDGIRSVKDALEDEISFLTAKKNISKKDKPHFLSRQYSRHRDETEGDDE